MAVHNYGPMWQLTDTNDAGGAEHAEPGHWEPPRVNPGGCAFSVDSTGRLDPVLLWGLPRRWDILGYGFAGSGDKGHCDVLAGVAVLSELLAMVNQQVSKASLMVRASHLAGGGDINPEVHGKGMQLGKTRKIEEIISTAGLHGPNVPGALMTQVSAPERRTKDLFVA